MTSHLRILLLGVLLTALPAVQAEPARLPGKFVWAELVTDNIKASTDFYGKVFGWSFQPETDDYLTVFNGDEVIGRIGYYPRPPNASARPRWISYVSVENLQTATQTVLAAGGSVRLPSRQLPGQGEQVVFADAEGALFGALRLQDGDPEDYLAEPGSWIWLELLSRDVQRAADFYHAVGGYELFADHAAGAAPHYLLARNGYARAAILPLSPRRLQEGVQPMWLPFVRVDSVTVAVNRVTALGGKVPVPPRATLFDGRAALIEDPAGALVGVMEWDAEPAGGETGL